MKEQQSESDDRRRGEAGFGIWQTLMLLVLIALIIAVAMKTMSVWFALLWFVVAAIVLGLIANFSDLIRYMKISSM